MQNKTTTPPTGSKTNRTHWFRAYTASSLCRGKNEKGAFGECPACHASGFLISPDGEYQCPECNPDGSHFPAIRRMANALDRLAEADHSAPTAPTPIIPIRGGVPNLIDAKARGMTYKNWKALKIVFEHLKIEYRFNTRRGAFEINLDDCTVNECIRLYVPEQKGWHAPSDEWDAWLRDYMREHFTWRGPGRKDRVREQPLQFPDYGELGYHNQIRALCGQAKFQKDPLIEYLYELNLTRPWDGVNRLDTWLTVLFGCDPNDERTAWFGRYLFGAPIWRTIKRGYKLDGVPILAGAQALGKSTILENLLPVELRDQLFTGSVNFGSQDSETIDMCRGKAIVEVGELAGIFGRELASLKQFVAQRSDTFRPKYGRRHLTLPRTWIIVGTADKSGDIIPGDPAGNRRWPVLWLPGNDLRHADRLEWLDGHRDQLWAEAWKMVGVDRTPVYWTDALQAKYGKEHQGYERRDESLESKIDDLIELDTFYTLNEIGLTLNLIEQHETLSTPVQRRLAEALRSSGFDRVGKRVGGRWRKGWRKDTPSAPPAPPATPATPVSKVSKNSQTTQNRPSDTPSAPPDSEKTAIKGTQAGGAPPAPLAYRDSENSQDSESGGAIFSSYIREGSRGSRGSTPEEGGDDEEHLPF